MLETAKVVVAELPSYLLNLVRLLVGPKQFIASLDLDTTSTPVIKAITFAIVSYLLSYAAGYNNLARGISEASSVGMYFAARVAIDVAAFVAFFVALYASLKSVGGRPPSTSVLVVHAYYYGTILVLAIVGGGLIEGWLTFSRRYFPIYEDPIQLVPSDFILLAAGLALFVTWGLAAWGAYRRIAGLSALRSAAALIVSGPGAIPGASSDTWTSSCRSRLRTHAVWGGTRVGMSLHSFRAGATPLHA